MAGGAAPEMPHPWAGKVLTSYYEIGVGKGVLCLHEGPGMSVVKHVKHTICIHPHWFCRRREKRERREAP